MIGGCVLYGGVGLLCGGWAYYKKNRVEFVCSAARIFCGDYETFHATLVARHIGHKELQVVAAQREQICNFHPQESIAIWHSSTIFIANTVDMDTADFVRRRIGINLLNYDARRVRPPSRPWRSRLRRGWSG